jgi:hypothetical protein
LGQAGWPNPSKSGPQGSETGGRIHQFLWRVSQPAVMRMRNLAVRSDEKPLRAESSNRGRFRALVNRSYPEDSQGRNQGADGKESRGDDSVAHPEAPPGAGEVGGGDKLPPQTAAGRLPPPRRRDRAASSIGPAPGIVTEARAGRVKATIGTGRATFGERQKSDRAGLRLQVQWRGNHWATLQTRSREDQLDRHWVPGVRTAYADPRLQPP